MSPGINEEKICQFSAFIGCAVRLLFVFAFSLSNVHPQSTLYGEALEKYRNQEYFVALAKLRQALEKDPRNPSHHHLCGLTLAALEQFTGAEEHLRKAIALDPERSDYQYDLGFVFVQQKKYDEAFEFLRRSVELNGDNLMARFLLGRAYVSAHQSLLIGNFSQLALEQFLAVGKKNPRFPSLHYHIAKIFLNEGKEHEGLQELRTELEFHPQNALARLELGELLLKLNQPPEALTQLLLVEKEAPTLNVLHYALAKAYRGDGKMAEAIKAARRSIELNPNFADAYYLLGLLYREAGEPELARQQLQTFQRLGAAQAH